MSLQKSVPKNKTIYFNNLQSHTTGSIPVSPTISTKIKYVRNNKDLACKPLKLLGYFYYQSLKRTYSIPNTFLKNSQKIGVFSPQIVCKSLLDIFQPLPKHDRVHRVRPKNSLFLLVIVCEYAYIILINKRNWLGDYDAL
jgi:hypothetical protein